MIRRELKLQLTAAQERQLEGWLWNLTGVYNWGLRKIELDARDGIYYSRFSFIHLLAGHSKKMEISGRTLEGVLDTVYTAWQRCFKNQARKPRLKGQRNKLNSIPFRYPIKPQGNRLHVECVGSVRFHKQDIPEGAIKSGRIIKRASGWYFSLVIHAEPNAIPHKGNGSIGIDPGFHDLLTLSDGEKISHPRELEAGAQRLAQAQRGGRKHLAARLQERQASRRTDRNHKLSRRLVSENQTIAWSKDSHSAIARSFGKSVASSSHAQLRSMLAYKCRAGGRQYIEVPSKNSTKTCSACGSLSGPTGYAGLSVRRWTCAECGSEHDRDVNAAVNTLNAGLGTSLERRREAATGIALRDVQQTGSECEVQLIPHFHPATPGGEGR